MGSGWNLGSSLFCKRQKCPLHEIQITESNYKKEKQITERGTIKMIINLKIGHFHFAKKVTFLFCLDNKSIVIDFGFILIYY